MSSGYMPNQIEKVRLNSAYDVGLLRSHWLHIDEPIYNKPLACNGDDKVDW